jgi:hypothetical protein
LKTDGTQRAFHLPHAEGLSAAGKPFKVVMAACMRKLVVILNAISATTNLGERHAPKNNNAFEPQPA